MLNQTYIYIRGAPWPGEFICLDKSHGAKGRRFESLSSLSFARTAEKFSHNESPKSTKVSRVRRKENAGRQDERRERHAHLE